MLYQTKRNINKLCSGKISLQKTLRIKFSIDSGFLNELYGKKKTTWKHQKSTENFLNKKAPSVNALPLLQNC